MRPATFRAYNPNGQAVASGDVPASGPVLFDAGEHFVERLVLYDDNQIVLGEITVASTGQISADVK